MKLSLFSRFLENITSQKLFGSNDKLLLAVSGGVDSAVLCELCHQARFHFLIAHCNFQLRGEESDRDELFVRNLAKKYEVEVLVRRFDTTQYAEENKMSIQVAARKLRYSWFAEIINQPAPKLRRTRRQSTKNNLQASNLNKQSAKNKNMKLQPKPTADYILTAHHLDDNIETIMMNFFKGTGISGLRGMLPKTGRLVRPLLFATKEEILAFAKETALDFVEDSSNQEQKYSRNYFRLQVLPLIEKIYPGALANIANNAQRFHEIEILYRQAIDMHRKKLIVKKGDEIHIPVEKLRFSIPGGTIVYDIVSDFGFTPAQTRQVLELMDSETGKYICSATHRILKNRNWLIISPIHPVEQGIVIINESDYSIEFSEGRLEFKRRQKTGEYQPSASSAVACIDASHIQFPILLRKWRKADYFYPLGMQKKKKLARFFIDQKLSKNEKENIWVLEMDKKILWVIGKRIDHRFRITDQTKEIVEIRLKTL